MAHYKRTATWGRLPTCQKRGRLAICPTLAIAILAAALAAECVGAERNVRPNVVLVLADDQGYGDVGFHGNPHLKTPAIDRFAAQGVRLDRSYVCPVCVPTRATLMTGRYYQRTGELNKYQLMAPDEYTLARALRDGGYATAIFGKWHLGDNYPLRPQDRGFQAVLTFTGGMIGDYYSPIEANSYYDPLLIRNGRETRCHGYVTELFFDEALKFIDSKARAKQPFFAYVALNAPHHPLTSLEAYEEPYRRQGLPVELYDINTDPNERHDIAAEHSDIVKALKERYLRWSEEVSAGRRGHRGQEARVPLHNHRAIVITLT